MNVKSMEEICLDYTNAMQQAKQIEDTAKQLLVLARSGLPACTRRVEAGWKGELAGSFVHCGRRLGADIGQNAIELSRMAAAVRGMAERIREADLAARRLALMQE